MRPALPVLSDYGISAISGFLPEEPPLRKLPNPYFAPWEDIIENFQALIMTRKLRSFIDKMPLLDASKLETEAEWQRATSVLGFLAHGYVWGDSQASDHLPSQVSKPWLQVSEHFDVPPINLYAGVCLWNFKPIVPGKPDTWDLDNLSTLTTFTGSVDESWFYLLSTALERTGGPCLALGLKAIQATRDDNAAEVTLCLEKLAEYIDSMTTVLGRMTEMCDPHTFYFRIRPFLAGWKNMADAGLPDGVRYGDEDHFRQYAGGSNAQSSLIQALDILLNVKHHPTGHRKGPDAQDDTKSTDCSERNNFIHEMRKYMPKMHRQFLEDLSLVAEIRDYVLEKKNDKVVGGGLALAYDACLAMLRTFRDKHIQIVTRYIVIQAKQQQLQQSSTVRQGLAKTVKGKQSRGTGGTALLPFLKQARDETGDPAAGSWGRRLLGDTGGSKRPSPFSTGVRRPVKKPRAVNADNEEDSSGDSSDSMVGLAGSWSVDDDNAQPVKHW